MATAVISSSPVSILSSAAVTPSTGAATSTPVAEVGADAEVSDFNAVLSPLLGNTEAGIDTIAASLLVPEAELAGAESPVSVLPLPLPEGLDLTAVLQQTAAGAGNTLPADGKVLPAAADDVPVDATQDLAAQLALPDAEGDTAAHTVAPAQSEQELQLDGEPLAEELVLPAQLLPSVDGEQVKVGTETVAAEQNAKGEAPDSKTGQPVLLTTVSAPPAASPGVASVADDLQTQAAQVATTALPANSRPVAQHADAAKATAPYSETLDTPAPAERTVSDLLSVPAATDAGDDVVKSAGFGRLLDAQATTSGQHPATDTAALGSKMLAGAVAYRMDGTTQVATTLVNQPVNTPQWSNEIGERVVWFGTNKIQHAEIELDPPELGPLQVRISTQNEQTTVTFSSHHAAVRDVLDQSLPRLKEMFSEQGLNLVQADVGDRRGAPQQQFEAQDGAASADSSADDDGDIGSDAATASSSKMRIGLVDAYA